MTQVLVSKCAQKPDYSFAVKVGSEAKNPLPTKMQKSNAMDLVGLSWIFMGEDFLTC